MWLCAFYNSLQMVENHDELHPHCFPAWILLNLGAFHTLFLLPFVHSFWMLLVLFVSHWVE